MSRARSLFYALTLAALVAVAWNFQWLGDQYYLRTFQPSPAMAQIIGQLPLTASAKAMLYHGRPRIDDKAAFNADCQPGRGELELGCFAGGRIYVLKITNPDLASEMQVVTAHELLHEAYTRLGSAERRRVDGWLEQAVAEIKDPDLAARLADYAKTEPGERDNELHSILGTEYANLPAPLEQYYGRYFTDRAKVVAAHAQYEAVFAGRKAQIDQELAAIRGLQGELAGLDAQMAGLKSGRQYAAYNALVPRQNALVDEVNRRIGQYNTDVAEYNDLSASLNSQQITPANL